MPDNDDRSPFSRRGSSDGAGGGSGTPRPRFAPWLIVPILLVALLVFNNMLSGASRESIAYSEFVTAVEDGRIDPETTVKISDSGISGALTTADGTQEFTTTLSPNVTIDKPFTDFLDENGVKYEFEQPSVLLSLLVNILPFALIMIGIYWFVFRRMGAGASGALNMGKNKVKIYDRKEMKTTFADVAKPRTSCARSSSSCRTRRSTSGSADASPRACCCSGPPGAARRCSPARWPARPTCRSSS
jgi:cell division protease FtsH